MHGAWLVAAAGVLWLGGCERRNAPRPALQDCADAGAASRVPPLRADAGEPEPGGEIALRIGREPPHLQALVGDAEVQDVVETALLHDVVQTLVRWDPRAGVLRPELARAWTVEDGGKRLVFRMGDATWHDGRPFSADDVVFTFERLSDPGERLGPVGEGLDAIARFSAPDPATFVLELSEPRRGILSSIASLPVLPRHVFGAARVTDHGANRAPVGTGPYRFADWTPGREIAIERVPGSRSGWLDRLRFRFAATESTAIELARRNRFDVVRFESLRRNDLPRDVLDGFERLAAPRAEVAAIAWRTDRPPFDDVELRRAIALLVDSRLRPDGGCRLPEAPWPCAPVSRRDAPEGERILDRLGWSRWDGRGVRLRRSGGRDVALRFRLAVFEGSPGLEALHAIRPQLRQSGVDLVFDVRPPGGLRTDADAVLLSWRVRGPDDVPFGPLHSSRAWPNGPNVGRFSDPEVDRLLEAMRREGAGEPPGALCRELRHRLAELNPILPVRSVPRIWLVSERVRGLDPIDPRGSALWVPAALR